MTRYLDELQVGYEVILHLPSSTAAEQTRAARVSLDRTACAVPLLDGRDFRVALIPGSRALDLNKVCAELGAGLRIATEEQLRSTLRGRGDAVLQPLAPLLRAPEIMDQRLLDHEQILIGGGDASHGVLIDPSDLVEAIQPRVADICCDQLRDEGARGHES